MTKIRRRGNVGECRNQGIGGFQGIKTSFYRILYETSIIFDFVEMGEDFNLDVCEKNTSLIAN